MITNNSTGKFILVTPSADPFSYGGDTNILTKALYLSAAGNVTCKNDVGDSIVIPFTAGATLPIATRVVSAVSAGTCVAFFE